MSKELKKIISILNKTPNGLWIREIARQSKLHSETVRRLIIKYPQIFIEYADFTPYKINLKLIKLKNPNITPKNIDKLLTT
jgi:DNA-binding IclR family transcriptional regulator